jgi:capsular polysaccharide transport system permease protein
LWTTAVDQYGSKVGFSVRREDTSSALEVLSGLTSLSGSSSSDTDILYEFLQNQKLVADMNRDLDLQKMWSAPPLRMILSSSSKTMPQLKSFWRTGTEWCVFHMVLDQV